MLFYASPVLYVATQVPEEFQRAYLANPIAAILTQVRHAVVDPTASSAATAIGDPVRLLIPLGIVVGAVRARPVRVQPDGAADRRRAVGATLVAR